MLFPHRSLVCSARTAASLRSRGTRSRWVTSSDKYGKLGTWWKGCSHSLLG